MQASELSRALVPVSGQEAYVKRRFWQKVRRVLGRVPFIEQAVGAFYAAVDPATPRHAKAVLMAALAYFVVPLDMIPDLVAGLGFSDDATVLLMAVQALAPHIKDDHVRRARGFLDDETAQPPPPAN